MVLLRQFMVFVTGATGLLGSHLLGNILCLNKQEDIYALKREGSKLDEVYSVVVNYVNDEVRWNRIHWVEGDILDTKQWENIIARAKIVYHCAAMVSFAEEDKERLLEVNLSGTENVARLCQKYDVRMCYVSSIAAVGDARYEGEVVDEETPLIMETVRSVYSQSKIAAENIVWKYIRKGLNAVIVNPSIIFGAGHWTHSSSRLFQTISKGMPFYTKGVCGYVDVRDVCRAMIRLANDVQVRGERFIVNGGNYSYKELFTAIANITGHRPPFIPMKPWMTTLAWRSLAVVRKIVGGKPAFTRETARASHHKSYYSSAKLQKQYSDFCFYTLDETLSFLQQAFRQTQSENEMHRTKIRIDKKDERDVVNRVEF